MVSVLDALIEGELGILPAEPSGLVVGPPDDVANRIPCSPHGVRTVCLFEVEQPRNAREGVVQRRVDTLHCRLVG